jgi:hypothetical protein
MSRGLASLEEERWQQARQAFEQASRLKPGAPEVADGLARVAAGERRDLVRTGIQTGQELEASERWADAERTYIGVLQTDPEAAAALDGRGRAKARADLDEKLEYYLANPGRLATPSVFEDASDLLDLARETIPRGPRLDAQVAGLAHQLERAATPVRIILESDSATEVMVYRVGRLGAFARRELELRPGTYTAVGSRDGYRDVRVEFQVAADGSTKTVTVSCTEAL